MRVPRIAIVALVAIGLFAAPAVSQIGQSGCPYDCYQVIDQNSKVLDSFCGSATSYGQYLTCKKVQWCWRDPLAGLYCDDPNCTGDTCMYV